MTIAIPILQILDHIDVRGTTAFLPAQLDRKTYEQVNKCLVAMGGKWNRKAKGHVFDEDPTERLDSAVLTGQVTDWRKELQYFPTPRAVVLQMLEWAEISGTETVLDPSAGQGAILDVIRERYPSCKLLANEINRKFAEMLFRKRYVVSCEDFLACVYANQPDRIVMNPPFTRQQDVDHVAHAFHACLRPGGVIVSAVSESPFFRTTMKAEAFRGLISEYGESIKLKAGAFSESGTKVNTRLVKLRKPQ